MPRVWIGRKRFKNDQKQILFLVSILPGYIFIENKIRFAKEELRFGGILLIAGPACSAMKGTIQMYLCLCFD